MPRVVLGVAVALLVAALAVPAVVIARLRTHDPASTAFSRAAGVVGPLPRVDLEHVAPVVLAAVVLSEDGTFAHHGGVELAGLRQALEGSGRGGSTITQQLVKNLWLSADRSWSRKAFELALALPSDAVLGKRRVLELYVNVVDWGQGTFGLCAASWRFFDRPPAELDASEAALLVSALPAPRDRDPARPSPLHRRLAADLVGRLAASHLGSSGSFGAVGIDVDAGTTATPESGAASCTRRPPPGAGVAPSRLHG